MNILEKYQPDLDIFDNALQAKVRSEELGLSGYIHVYDMEGQAYFMPGMNHQTYLDRIAEINGIEIEDDEPVSQSDMETAIRTILEVIMNKKQEVFIETFKVDEEQRMIYGWASVSTVNGKLLIDKQGDAIEPDTLEKAVNDFMEHVRVGKTMHQEKITGQVIHSLPVTKQLCEALGIKSDIEGWIVGYKVYDDSTWEGIKSGKYKAFSIGGRAIKEEYNA